MTPETLAKLLESRDHAIDELARSEARLRALVEAIPDLLFRVSANGTFLDFKTPDEAQLAVPPDRIIGTNLAEGPFPPALVRRGLSAISDAIANDHPQTFQYELEVPLGKRHFECRVVRSGLDECVFIVRDVTDRVQADAALEAGLERLRESARHDRLTGLLDREAVRTMLDLAVRSAERRRTSVAVLFIDLDGFKEVNDRCGHLVGDAVLSEAASTIQAAIRSRDVVGRMGGDEFAVVLEDIKGPDEARAVGRKIAESIAADAVVDDPPIRLTASVGLALYPEDGADAPSLLDAADRAMYEAKRARVAP